jgi:hypothetical protein
LLASHHPPNAKKAEINPPASAAPGGGDPACRATKGTKFPQSPRPIVKPPTTITASAPSLSTGQRGQRPRARLAADDVQRGRDENGANRHELHRRRAHRHEIRGIGRDARGERGRDARVHDEQALPAVEEREPAAVGFAQVDVAAAGLGNRAASSP